MNFIAFVQARHPISAKTRHELTHKFKSKPECQELRRKYIEQN